MAVFRRFAAVPGVLRCPLLKPIPNPGDRQESKESP